MRGEGKPIKERTVQVKKLNGTRGRSDEAESKEKEKR